jgi:Tol biopolymer transport system component
MTARDDFTGVISDWLDDQAGHGAPDYLAEILARTTRTRQRPAWSSLERWLPMQTTLRFALVPRFTLQLIVIALLIALALAGALIIGSSRTHPAPPFGPARNGSIVFASAGDLFRLDPRTGVKAPVLTGPGDDAAPYYSRDGLQVVWLRVIDRSTDTVVVYVANADGTNARAVTGPLKEQNWFDWSQDGARLALVSTIDGIRRLTIARVDGSGSATFDLPVQTDSVTWLGPNGDKLLFRGRPISGGGPASTGLYSVSPDGTNLTQVTAVLGDSVGGYQGPVSAPDGSRITYTSFDSTDGRSPDGGTPNIPWDGKLLRIHVLDLATGADIVIPSAADPTNATVPIMQAYGAFSPDGRWLAFQRTSNDGSYDLGIAPADGSAPGRQIGPRSVSDGSDNTSSYEFTPDGTAVVATYPHEPSIRLVPVDGSAPTTLPLAGNELPSMQRLALTP